MKRVLAVQSPQIGQLVFWFGVVDGTNNYTIYVVLGLGACLEDYIIPQLHCTRPQLDRYKERAVPWPLA